MRRNEPPEIWELQRCRWMGASASKQSAANDQLSTRNKSACSARTAGLIEARLGGDGDDECPHTCARSVGERLSGCRAVS